MLKIKKYTLPAICLLFVLSVNIYFRAFPIYFPQLKKQAQDMVRQKVSQIVTQETYNKFPQFNPLARDKLIKAKVAQYYRVNRKALNNETGNLYRQLKDRFQDEKGQTYIMELDCWHWGRYVDNIVRFHHPGDEVINGRQFDNLMLAPSGDFLYWDNFLYYFSAFLYKIFSLFKRLDVYTFVFYLPLLFSTILILALYFFSYRLAGEMGAIVACLLVITSPTFMPRSCAGWFDKDIFNVLFPLLAVWTYALSYEAQTFKRRIPWLVLAGLCIGLFCFTWMSWWFIFLIIIIYEFFSIAGILSVRWLNKEINYIALKQRLVSLGIFILSGLFWIIVFCGLQPFQLLFGQLGGLLALNKPLIPSIWPNVFYTVGEMKKANITEVANSFGTPLIFWLSVICLLFLAYIYIFKQREPSFKRESVLILFSLFWIMLFACSRGVRFAMFLLIPSGVSLGMMLNELYKFSKNKIRKLPALCLAVFLTAVISMNFINKGGRVARGIYPLMNDTWYKVLTIMRDSASKGSIINSWWDFGDWFKVVARRKVIFDGQSQNVPQAYWMARVLLAGNEEEAIRILRMLNNGGNKAFEIINKYLQDPLKSVLLLEGVLVLEPERAKANLLDFLPASAASQVLQLIFTPSVPALFVVDPSMPSKMGAISYLGTWSFAKVYLAQNIQRREKEQIADYLVKLGRDKQEVERLYQEASLISPQDVESWLSSPFQFYSNIINGELRGDSVYFDNGFIYKPGEQTIYANSGQIPRSLFIFRQDTLVEVVYTNSNVGFSVLVFKTKNRYNAILLNSELANSLFVRLYYLGGAGLTHFKSFIEAEEGSDYTRVFQIIW